jgi:hypothetical protein
MKNYNLFEDDSEKKKKKGLSKKTKHALKVAGGSLAGLGAGAVAGNMIGSRAGWAVNKNNGGVGKFLGAIKGAVTGTTAGAGLGAAGAGYATHKLTDRKKKRKKKQTNVSENQYFNLKEKSMKKLFENYEQYVDLFEDDDKTDEQKAYQRTNKHRKLKMAGAILGGGVLPGYAARMAHKNKKRADALQSRIKRNQQNRKKENVSESIAQFGISEKQYNIDRSVFANLRDMSESAAEYVGLKNAYLEEQSEKALSRGYESAAEYYFSQLVRL